MLIVPLVSMLLETAIDPVHNIVLIHSYTENARPPRSPEDVICTLSESFNMSQRGYTPKWLKPPRPSGKPYTAFVCMIWLVELFSSKPFSICVLLIVRTQLHGFPVPVTFRSHPLGRFFCYCFIKVGLARPL